MYDICRVTADLNAHEAAKNQADARREARVEESKQRYEDFCDDDDYVLLTLEHMVNRFRESPDTSDDYYKWMVRAVIADDMREKAIAMRILSEMVKDQIWADAGCEGRRCST